MSNVEQEDVTGRELVALRGVAEAARAGLTLTKHGKPIVISPDDLVRLYELALRETEAALAVLDTIQPSMAAKPTEGT